MFKASPRKSPVERATKLIEHRDGVNVRSHCLWPQEAALGATSLFGISSVIIDVDLFLASYMKNAISRDNRRKRGQQQLYCTVIYGYPGRNAPILKGML